MPGTMDTEQTYRASQQLAVQIADIAQRCSRVMQQQWDALAEDDGFRVIHPVVVAHTFSQLALEALKNPAAVIDQQIGYWEQLGQLWERSARRMLFDEPVEPMAVPAPGDRRFHDKLWVESAVFDVVKQCYLLTARHMQTAVGKVDGLDQHTSRKVQFFTRQFVDAMSPANFALTNPEVIRTTVESGGQNLLKGVSLLLDDLERNHGRWDLKITDLDAFKVGENLALSPGKVVFQNDLIQLIQYAPSTETVRQRPLLIIPPWINKFYVLDLKPQNSFIRWAVGQGHTVFLISWVNPDDRLAGKSFDDYLMQGPLAAFDAMEQATGERRFNVIGYCIGGTLLSMALAYMAAKRDKRVVSATFFTSLLDFSDSGDISVFIDDEQLRLMEDHMKRKGYLEGHHLAQAFSLLRENDLIWSFVVKNYLLGREPMPFDILYWNSDSTHMTAAMHSFYLRNMYERNLLREPGGVTLGGVKIDLGRVSLPACFVSTREDHIAPWKSVYAGARLLSGPVRFLLGGSGHIAGVVNPPAAKKYGYWTNDGLPAEPDEWLAGAVQHEGSWWSEWDTWVAQFGGKTVPARQPGDGALPPLEDAPGSYVKRRIE